MKGRRPLRALAGALALCLASCSHGARADPHEVDRLADAVAPPGAAGAAVPPVVSAAPAPPLAAAEPIVPLAVDGYADAIVSIPIGATSPRPILVAAHGLWDPPEGLCDNWRWIVGDRAWVLCPRGEPRADKTFRFASGPALAAEIDAGLRALARRYPAYVDEGPVVFTGFSRGAIFGDWVVTHDPARFPRAVLIEGGEDGWTESAARAYAAGGGARVLFACGLRARVPAATAAAGRLERAGVPSRVVLGKLPETGQFIHWYNGPVAEEIKARLGWLLEGDERW